MTDNVMDRLSASNPLPEGSTAPPFEAIAAQVHAAGPPARRWRPLRLLGPAFSVAIAIFVIVVAVGGLRTNHRTVTRPAHVPTAPPPIPATPAGMHGLVYVQGVGFSSASDGVISLQQCLGCRNNGDQTAHSTDRYWLVSTRDGGRTWNLSARRYSIQQPLFIGQNGWAGGLQATGPEAGGIARYYVTHDGGRSWNVAPTAAPNEGGGLVSLGGNEAWAIGLSTQVAILHAPVAGSRLTATASQPIHGDQTNVAVIAGDAGTAYAFNSTASRETFVTHDDGRTWQHIAPPCPRGSTAALAGAYGETVWANCSSARGQTTGLVRSDDGGRSWQQLPAPTGTELRLQPVSARVAWALVAGGKVLRTTDAGRTWRTVWSSTDPREDPFRSQGPAIAALSGSVPILVAETSSSASVVTLITHGHTGQQARLTNLVVYRTADDGQTWRPYVVPLTPP